jgi:ElaB/YqjD/DUF883 family membrane-anchored ribosome-binding protein
MKYAREVPQARQALVDLLNSIVLTKAQALVNLLTDIVQQRRIPTMKRTQEALGNLVNYEAVSGIRPLNLLTVEKADIPKFILCQNYDKAKQKVERTMERYNKKVESLRQDIDAQVAIIKKANEETKYCDTSNAQSVARHNDWVDRGRKASEKRNDLIDRHNEALEDARERLEELTQDALATIDDDLVAVLDKCTQTATRLSDSENSEDLMSSLETCFIGLKVFSVFEEHIDGNVARKEARERVSEINEVCAELCAHQEARNYLVDLFRRNTYLIEKNAELYAQVVEVIEGVDQGTLDEMAPSFHPIFEKKFNTSFKYEGIVNPSTLDGVVTEMHKTIDALKANIAKVKELDASTRTTAEAAVSVHQSAESTLATMKTNMEEMRDDILFKGHFACDLLDEEVIEDFYHRELRPAVTAFREHLVDAIGEEELDTLVMEDEERYSIEKAQASIKQADLLRLQAQRARVAGYVSELSTLIKDVEADIQEAGEVPRKNAAEFRSSASSLYGMSWFPVLGFAFAMGVQGKIKKFAPAFKSPLEIYQKLGTEILAKNKTMQTVALILGVVLGLGGIGIFFGTSIGASIAASLSLPPMAVNIGIPGVVLVLYLSTWVILSSAGKTLQSYIASSKTATTQ